MKLSGVKFKKTQQKEVFFPTWTPSTLQNSLPKDVVDTRVSQGFKKKKKNQTITFLKKREKMQTVNGFNSTRNQL